MNRNKLLLLAVVVVVLMAIYLLVKILSGGEDKPSSAPVLPPQQVVPAPAATTLTPAERDTYVNTIQTINERNRRLEERLNALEQERLKKKDQDKNLDQMVSKLVEKKVEEKSQGFFESYKKDFEKLIGSLPGMDSGEPYKKPSSFGDRPQKNGLPGNGAGLDSILNPGQIIGGTKNTGAKPVTAVEIMGSSDEPMVTITPFTQVAYSTDDDPVPVDIVGNPIRKEEDLKTRPGRKAKSEDDPRGKRIPFYTIPRNATLFSNTTLTALLGIVPNVEGSVLDPIRFKVITGAENLATNGHYIPGIKDIVWSGIAIGNREMSCVRGEVHSVTFTFEDGTVYTQSSTQDGDVKTTNVRKILGYISDTRGKPCIRGKLITNATDYLKDRVSAAGASSLAEAYANTEQTNITTPDSVTQSVFTGNKGDYIAGKTFAASLQELADYIRERARGAIDLVYLDGGQDVVLHIESEITIDYFTKGRKLNYANQIPQNNTVASRHFD